MKIPHAQRFISILAVHNANHKRGKNLEARVLDYERMISQSKIADGHRDATGYKRPGSNKK